MILWLWSLITDVTEVYLALSAWRFAAVRSFSSKSSRRDFGPLPGSRRSLPVLVRGARAFVVFTRLHNLTAITFASSSAHTDCYALMAYSLLVVGWKHKRRVRWARGDSPTLHIVRNTKICLCCKHIEY